MKTVPLRHLADLNPSTPEFDRIPAHEQVTFLPLETVWSDARADHSRLATKSDVANGYTRFRAGDVVSPKVTPTFQAGRSMVARSVGAGTTELHILRPRQGVDARWLNYAVRSKPFLDEGVATFQGVAGLQRVPPEFVNSFRVADYAPDEQRRIADFLDDRVFRIDRIIAARRDQIVQARKVYESKRRSSILGTTAIDRRTTDLPWALSVGSDRVVRRLAQMATMGTGHTPSKSNADYWVHCTIPWLTTSDVHRFRRDEIDEINDPEIFISELGLANSSAVLHPAGTVALSRTASAGFSIVMGTDMATSQDFVTWTCGPDLEPHFLLASLRVMRPFLLGYLATGSTHKTIYFPDLMDLRLPVPPVTTQREAVDEIQADSAAYWSGNEARQRQVDLLTEYKSSLITAAVTGELDVTTAGSNIPG